MMHDWSLRLELIGPHGERVALAMRLADDIASDLVRIDPPSIFAPFEMNFDAVVRILKRREFRKSLFRDMATRLGVLLAERMEDAEGWHDAERIDPARKQLGMKP